MKTINNQSSISATMAKIENDIKSGVLSNNHIENARYGLINYLECIIENGYNDWDANERFSDCMDSQAFSYLIATLEDEQLYHYVTEVK